MMCEKGCDFLVTAPDRHLKNPLFNRICLRLLHTGDERNVAVENNLVGTVVGVCHVARRSRRGVSVGNIILEGPKRSITWRAR